MLTRGLHRDTHVTLPHRRVPGRDNALPARLLRLRPLLVHLARADRPLSTARAEQRPQAVLPRRYDPRQAVLRVLYVRPSLPPLLPFLSFLDVRRTSWLTP